MPCNIDPNLIESSDLFRGLAPAVLDGLRASAAVRPFPAGATLFRQDEEPTHLQMVAAGRLKVVHLTADGGQLALGYRRPGELLGCSAVVRPAPHLVTAVAVEASVAWSWTATQIEALLEEHPAVLRNVARLLCREIEDLLQRVKELTTERAEQRVARAVRRLTGAEAQTLPSAGRPLLVSRQDLAELAGTTLFTVSRIMSAWEQQGIVESGRQRVVVLDADRLAHLADGR